MPSAATLLAFLAVTGTMLLVPGPSVMFAVARTVDAGLRAGLYTVVGLEAGLTVHVAGAVTGVSSVAGSSDTALAALRYGGAAYLLGLAAERLWSLRTWRASGDGPGVPTPHRPGRTRSSLVRDALLIDVLNPKTALLFVAFLPQFVDPARGSPTLQLLTLGCCVVCLAFLCDGGYVLATAWLSQRAGATQPRSGRRAAWAGAAVAAVYVALAAASVLT